MVYFTYILISKNSNKTYVGHTDNLNRRLIDHNHGKSKFSNMYKPWSIIYKEGFGTLGESIARERYLKSAAGRRWMKKNLFS
jgi:putative endonuclease